MSGPYTDHHVHFLAAVAARLSVDVTSARDGPGLVAAISDGATGSGWVRAWGYEEWRLAGGRGPTRDDLDRAVPGRPVVLHHRTGHAAVLNSAALREIGQPDHPDGVLIDRHDLLDRVPRLDPAPMRAAAEELSAAWQAAGVGAFVDATHTNGIGELELLADWCARGVIRQAVTAMVGPDHVGSVPGYGGRVGAVTVGAVKLMPTPGGLGGIAAKVAAAHESGFPVAVHVVEIDVLDATLDGLQRSAPPDGTDDRIEHNALSLPEQVGRIAESKAVVVVNPSFLAQRRGKYETELTPLERTWLIRMGSLRRAGVVLRAGSDAPVTASRPDQMIRAAVAHPFAADESLGQAEAEMLVAPLPVRPPSPRPSG
jgi:predicted amidohydrolase YtcJ